MTELIIQAMIHALRIDGKEVIKYEQPLPGLPVSETHLS